MRGKLMARVYDFLAFVDTAGDGDGDGDGARQTRNWILEPCLWCPKRRGDEGGATCYRAVESRPEGEMGDSRLYYYLTYSQLHSFT